VAWRYGGRDFSGVGAGDAARCAALAVQILHLEQPCGPEAAREPGGCTFAGAWGGAGSGQQRLVLASFFFDRLVDTGVVQAGAFEANATVSDFAAAAARACGAGAQGLDAVARAFPAAPRAGVPWLCFDLSYQAALLRQGFGLAADRPLTVVKKLVHQGWPFEASWALGMALKSIKKVSR